MLRFALTNWLRGFLSECTEMQSLYDEHAKVVREKYRKSWCFWKFGGEIGDSTDSTAMRLMKELRKNATRL